MNGTLFSYFTYTANKVARGNFTRDTIISYQALRYKQSLADNGQFFYGPYSFFFLAKRKNPLLYTGPKAILLLGAATLVFHLYVNLISY